jgi:signal transduction histidine kinase/CheY-like chemotaxis protein
MTQDSLIDEHRALIFPPSRRDGDAIRTVLNRAGISSLICFEARTTAVAIEAGAGVLVVSDAVLGSPDFDPIVEALQAQPPWSDLPVVLLCPPNAQSDALPRVSAAFTNVTLLERPASVRTLVSAVQVALRARKRQYETRQQLAALQKAQESLRARERQLREADRRKDEFLAMLAHELRNPLAPIRNVSEILIHGAGANERIEAMAGILRRQINQLTRIVDDLLDVSRVTQGRIELQRGTVDLAAVVSDACESVQPLISERGHVLHIAVVPSHVYVNGDRERLIQCVSNLLINAVKYTDRGGRIEVDVRPDGPEVCLSVTDNGVGIAPELLPQIFELFVQSARSLDRSQGGLGIGLSVVRRLIEMHGGKVTASSAGLGQGARFEIRLTRTEAPAARKPEQRAPPPKGKQVLVVDDNRDAADSLVMILTSVGHLAHAAYTPAEALAFFDSQVPDVVLLDIGLPGMDGYQVARLIRAKKVPTRIVALTGYGQPDDIKKAAAAGIEAHLVKPVDISTLEAILAGPGETKIPGNVLSFERRRIH